MSAETGNEVYWLDIGHYKPLQDRRAEKSLLEDPRPDFDALAASDELCELRTTPSLP